jgi:TetR/AcrR family transcriptional regulator
MQVPTVKKLDRTSLLDKTVLLEKTGSLGKSGSVRKSRMHAEDRHRQLLRIAIDVFARNGFSGTKTKDIAAAAGVSEAILFRHFATKEDLYRAILDMKGDPRTASQCYRELQEFMDARDDAGLFNYLAAQVFASFREDPAFHRLMVYASLEGHLLANLFRERFVLPTGDLLGKYITLRQREHAFRKCDPKVAGMFAIGTIVHYAMSRHVFGFKKPAQGDRAALAELVQLVLGGLTGGAAASCPETLAPRKYTSAKGFQYSNGTATLNGSARNGAARLNETTKAQPANRPIQRHPNKKGIHAKV